MKATALIAAAALACGTAAYAQQSSDYNARHHDATRAEQQDHDRTGNSLGNDMHRLGNKIRSGMHRLGEKLHARNDHNDNTRAMGASGTDDHGRQSRMDEAYSRWHSKHDGDQRR
ncbi:MAG TPA: hypothetical protein VIE63_02290 [Ramlibacter sp.]